MKEININNKPIEAYIAKTLDFAESFHGMPYPREIIILYFSDNTGYYLGVQYDHNRIAFISEDRYFDKHDVDLLINCADKKYNFDDHIEMWFSIKTNA